MFFDRFDIVEAYFCFFMEWYCGQNCPRYARLCRMDGYFKPRPDLSSDTLSENGRIIYNALAALEKGIAC
jgi:hypothetical protein